jgi:LuxR family transcriptional regulator, maltose regulon positive regulatory protein
MVADLAQTLPAVEYALRPLESRLRPPRPCLALVVRRPLLDALRTSSAPLTLVSAPAGAGKTALLMQYFDEVAVPKAWLTLDDDANDPIVLLTYVSLALTRVAEVEPAVLEWLRLPGPPIHETILPSLGSAIAAASPFVLVLDDGHRLVGETGWRLLETLFDALPGGARVVIGARRDPDIPLARLRALGRLQELRFPDLALDRGEAARLLAMNGGHADDAELERLLDATEGWAAGLYLAALTGTVELRGDRREVGQYLTSEVLEQQPAELRRFLLETSILERLCPDLCRVVARRDDAGEVLRGLARENLFVWALDERDQWYRYHHLFAEYLQAELSRRAPAEVARLHSAAAAWFEDEGDVGAAVRHWLAAGEVARAALIVSRVATSYAGRTGRLETVRRWLELFSDEQIRADVPLALVAGWFHTMSGDLRLGRVWVDAALGTRVDDTLHPDGGTTLRGWHALVRSGTGADGVTQMRQDAELAAAPEVAVNPAWRAGAGTVLGFACWISGEHERAGEVFRRSAELGRACNVIAELGALAGLSYLAMDDDRWADAESYAAEAMRLFAESALSAVPPMAVAFLAQAKVLAHQGEAAAADHAAAAAAMFEQGKLWPWSEAVTATLLGEIYLDLGELGAAQRWSDETAACLVRWPDAGTLRDRAERLKARLLERRGVEPLTRAEMRVLELLPTQLSVDEIAGRLFISTNTVKTHVRAVYRKLEVTSRTRAVERAREVDLLPG